MKHPLTHRRCAKGSWRDALRLDYSLCPPIRTCPQTPIIPFLSPSDLVTVLSDSINHHHPPRSVRTHTNSLFTVRLRRNSQNDQTALDRPTRLLTSTRYSDNYPAIRTIHLQLGKGVHRFLPLVRKARPARPARYRLENRQSSHLYPRRQHEDTPISP